MKGFLDDDFLLTGDTARRLYHETAAAQPVFDYHCHLSAREIWENEPATDIGALWLGGDHYKWRLMRAGGVPERLITGDAPMRDKFIAYAGVLEKAIGNPLYIWSHLELRRYFGIDTPLSQETANDIYDRANAVIRNGDFSPRALIQRSNVTALCTTDDPLDDLGYHMKLAESNFPVRVLPTFRPDRALQIDKPEYRDYILRFGETSGLSIDSVSALKTALIKRLEHFQACGCPISDHGLDRLSYCAADEEYLDVIFCRALSGDVVSRADAEAFVSAMLVFLAGEYRRRDIVMQLHFGCLRNPSRTMFDRLGADAGFDSTGDAGNANALSCLLSAMEEENALPKTILYPLNPNDNEAVLSVMGAFQTEGARIQFGSAWWFADHDEGITKQLKDLASMGVLGNFVGMLTDSRSYLSYVRHEYFRRILCRQIGEWVENGEYPDNRKSLDSIVCGICYENARAFFG